MSTFNDTAEIYCTLTLRSAEQQGVADVSNAEVRRQAITGLVTLVVARKVAKNEGVTVNPTSYELTASQKAQLEKAFPRQDIEALGRVIQDSQENFALSIAIGEKVAGQTRTDANESALAQAGQAEVTKAFEANDVRFAPRFGLGRTMKPIADTGSLSAAEIDPEKPASDELPTAQRCS